MKKQLTVVLLVLVLVLTAAVGIACQPKTYSLTYYTGGGSGTAPSVELLEEGATVTVKANMFTAPEGKEFDCWSDGTNKYQPNDTFKMPAKDVELTAVWKDKSVGPQPEEKWTVTFKCDGQDDVVVQVVKGEKLTAEQIPAAPSVAEGKEFKGWFNGETQITVDTVISGNITATAKIENKPVEKVTVIFKIGDNTVGTKQVVKGGKLTQDQFPDYTPDEGKVLVGWFDSEDNKIDENTVINSDLTVTAKIENAQPALTPEAFVGTYDFIDGYYYEYVLVISQDGDALKTKVDEYPLVNATLAWVSGKQQLTFSDGAGSAGLTYYLTLEEDGSYTLTASDEDEYEITKRAGGDEPQQWTVTFDPNNEGETWTVKVNDGEKVAKPADNPTIANGKAFQYWQDDNGEYDFNSSVTANITLTAKYAWKITYIGGEGAKGEMEPSFIGYRDALSACEFTKDGYMFKHWTDGTTTYTDGQSIIPTSCLELTAVWELIPTSYKVSYVKASDNKLVSSVQGDVPAEATIDIGAKITMPSADGLSLAHYTFAGWLVQKKSNFGIWQTLKDENNKLICLAPNAEYTMPAMEIRIAASWTANKVTVSFNANGGTGEMTAAEGNYAGKYNLPSCTFTAPDGQVFIGWSTSVDGDIISETQLTLDSKVVSDQDTITLYANWATPLTIDQVKGSWAVETRTVAIEPAAADLAAYNIVGHMVIDGKNYYNVYPTAAAGLVAYSLDGYSGYLLSLSEQTLTLASLVDETSIVVSNKAELVNADRASFVGEYYKKGTTQTWTITSNAVTCGSSAVEVLFSAVVGDQLVIDFVQEISGYEYYFAYVLTKSENSLVGWYVDPEKAPAATVFAPVGQLPSPTAGKLADYVGSYGYDSLANAGANAIVVGTSNVQKLELKWLTDKYVVSYLYGESTGEADVLVNAEGNPVVIADQDAANAIVKIIIGGKTVRLSFQTVADKKVVSVLVENALGVETWNEVEAEPVTPPVQTKTLADYAGEWTGSLVLEDTNYTEYNRAVVEANKVTIYESASSGSIARELASNIVDGNLVATGTTTYAGATITFTLTFTSDNAMSLNFNSTLDGESSASFTKTA